MAWEVNDDCQSHGPVQKELYKQRIQELGQMMTRLGFAAIPLCVDSCFELGAKLQRVLPRNFR